MHVTSFPDPVPGVELTEEERARWDLVSAFAAGCGQGAGGGQGVQSDRFFP